MALVAYSQKPAGTDHSAISLSLQSLIDLRYEIIRNKVNHQIGRSGFPGQRTGTRRGQGLEFIDLRQYNEADDVRHIDWNVTARTNEPHTRLYREEREHVTTVIVDLRPIMFNGSECLRAVAAGRLASALLWQASYAGDRTSAIVLSAPGIQSTRPASGTKGVLDALELIATGFIASNNVVESNKQHHSPPTLAAAFQLTNHQSSYFVFSGFDDDQFTQNTVTPWLETPAQLQAILLLDKLEQQSMPAGVYQYKSGDTARKSVRINASNTMQLTNSLAKDVGSRMNALKQAGVPLITMATTISVADFHKLAHQLST